MATCLALFLYDNTALAHLTYGVYLTNQLCYTHVQIVHELV